MFQFNAAEPINLRAHIATAKGEGNVKIIPGLGWKPQNSPKIGLTGSAILLTFRAVGYPSL